MSTEAITASKRNIENTRRSYIDPKKTFNPTLNEANLKATNLANGSPIPSKVVILPNTPLLASQNIDSSENHDNSDISHSHINTDFMSNTHHSFVPKMTSEPAKAPTDTTIDQVTGDGFNNLLTEIAEASANFFASLPKQINLMASVTNSSSMSLWKLLSTASIAAGKNAQENMDKQIQSARDAAKGAGTCAAITGVIEAVAAALVIAASYAAATAAAPFTGGASYIPATIVASSCVGIISGAVMIADGVAKAQAGARLAMEADSTTDIEGLIQKLLPTLQFGIFSLLTSETGGDPAKAQEWFNIISAVVAICSASVEMFGTKALNEAGAEIAASASIRACRAISLTNSAVMVTGMIASASDTNCTPTMNDGHTHTLNLWQALSTGLAGALVYMIFEVPLGGKTAAEKLKGENEYADIIAEFVVLAAAMVVETKKIEMPARSAGIDPKLQVAFALHMKANLCNFGLQSVSQSGQAVTSTLLELNNAAALQYQANAQKTSSEMQVLETCVQSLTAQNNQTNNNFIKILSQTFQTYGAFLTSLKEAMNNNTKASRSLFA